MFYTKKKTEEKDLKKIRKITRRKKKSRAVRGDDHGDVPVFGRGAIRRQEGDSAPAAVGIRPISPLTLSLLRSLDSNFPGNSLRAWECHPLKLRLCLSQTF